MDSQNDIQLPSYFAEMIESNALPIPPIPLAALPHLEEREESFFATDERPYIRNFAYVDFASLDMFDEEDEPAFDETGLCYAACGLLGKGVQNRYCFYALEAVGLRIVLSLPWGGAYGNAEEERTTLEGAFHIIELCQCKQESIREKGILELVIGDNACLWRLKEHDVPEEDANNVAFDEDIELGMGVAELEAMATDATEAEAVCLAQGASMESLLNMLGRFDVEYSSGSKTNWLRI